MLIFFIIVIIALFLFIPIPIFFELHYFKNAFHIFLYKKEITFKKRVSKKVEHEIKDKDYIGKIIYYHDFFKDTLSGLKKVPLKPKLNLMCNLEYGLEDASETAISFGFFNILPEWIYSIIYNYVVIDRYEFNIKPHYKSYHTNFYVKSIFKISIANTIYIVILILFKFVKDIKIYNHHKKLPV